LSGVTSTARQALLIGVLVLLARVATLPRTPWEAADLRFPFVPMLVLSVVASAVTAGLIAMRDPLASVVFSFSAAVLVHAPAARTDATAWMFVVLALGSLRKPVLLGLFTGAAVACGVPSATALFVAALMLVVTGQRDRVLAAIAFVIVVLPFLGIPENLGAASTFSITRFTLHPWGSKFVWLPLLIAVAAGVRPIVRSWTAELEVLFWFAVVHIAAGVAFVDPADGVRYAVPALLFVSDVAAAGLRELRVRWIGAVAIAALSVWYAYPILRDRVTRPSPVIEAARAIPRGVVVLADPSTAPFAGASMPVDAGLRRHVDDAVPLLHFADGSSNEPGARVFARDDRDAYGKLTRNSHRRVSLIPIEHRYAPERGVYGIERNDAGQSWRWLEREAVVRVPQGRERARVTLRLPADASLAANEVQINATRVLVRRGETIEAQVPLEQPLLLFRATRAFGLQSGDTRRVAVQLVAVE
jgi:hypothetical protein